MDELFKALPQLLRAAGESAEVSEAAAFAAWRRVAGEAMRGSAVPFRLYNKTLVIAVPDATWRKQLEQVSRSSSSVSTRCSGRPSSPTSSSA